MGFVFAVIWIQFVLSYFSADTQFYSIKPNTKTALLLKETEWHASHSTLYFPLKMHSDTEKYDVGTYYPVCSDICYILILIHRILGTYLLSEQPLDGTVADKYKVNHKIFLCSLSVKRQTIWGRMVFTVHSCIVKHIFHTIRIKIQSILTNYSLHFIFICIANNQKLNKYYYGNIPAYTVHKTIKKS